MENELKCICINEGLVDGMRIGIILENNILLDKLSVNCTTYSTTDDACVHTQRNYFFIHGMCADVKKMTLLQRSLIVTHDKSIQAMVLPEFLQENCSQ